MNKNHLNNSVKKFIHASRKYSDASIFMHEAIARKAGLTGTDHKYLGLIMQQTELTAGDISRLTGLSTGAVTGLVDRLEKKGLVQRKFPKNDRRKVHIIPNNDRILNLLEPTFKELQHRTMELLSSFSEEEIEVVERYFRAATNTMNEMTDYLTDKS